MIIGLINGTDGMFINAFSLLRLVLLFLTLFFSTTLPTLAATAPDCFIRAYKNHVISIKKEPRQLYLIMKSKSEFSWFSSNNMSLEKKIENPSLSDVVSSPYPAYRRLDLIPNYNEDPGRFRNTEFLKAVYGNSEEKVKSNLVKIRWLPKTLSHKSVYLLFNKQNNAGRALEKTIEELDNLPLELKKYLTNKPISFEWRTIAGSDRLSPHAWGIAIDVVDTKYRNYWRDDYSIKENESSLSPKMKFKYRNKIPIEIVNAFEKHGFIWGGRWYHYDTEHFEYRPEFFSCY